MMMPPCMRANKGPLYGASIHLSKKCVVDKKSHAPPLKKRTASTAKPPTKRWSGMNDTIPATTCSTSVRAPKCKHTAEVSLCDSVPVGISRNLNLVYPKRNSGRGLAQNRCRWLKGDETKGNQTDKAIRSAPDADAH